MPNKALINFHKASSAAVKSEGLKHSVNIADGKEVIGHFCDELVKAANANKNKLSYWHSREHMIGEEVVRLVQNRAKRKK